MIIYPQEYCIFDFETTGLDPLTSKIIEIGALRVENGKPVEQLSWLLNWPGLVVPEIITQITGINTDMLSLGHTPALALYEFKEFTKGLPLIGHNIINFDLHFLGKIDEEINPEAKDRMFDMPGIRNKCVDTAALFKASKIRAQRFWHEHLFDFCKRVVETKAYGVKFNVGVACDELGIDKSAAQQHRAEGDVYLTNEIYKKICLKK